MRFLKALIPASLGVLVGAMSLGVFSASAVETVLHDYVCTVANPVGSGTHDDNRCRTLGGTTNYYWRSVGSTPEKVKFSGLKAFEVETTVGGVSSLITCTTELGTGTVSNPEPKETTNGKGTATLTLEGCSVSAPTGCAIPGKKFTTNELNTVLEANKTLGWGVKFSAASEVLGEVTFEKCSKGELNKKYAIKGTAFGIANNKESSLEFTNASSALTFGGSAATLRGISARESTEGAPLMIAP